MRVLHRKSPQHGGLSLPIARADAPEDVQVLALLGTAYRLNKNPKEAIKILEKVVATRDGKYKFEYSYANLGAAYQGVGQFQDSIFWS